MMKHFKRNDIPNDPKEVTYGHYNDNEFESTNEVFEDHEVF